VRAVVGGRGDSGCLLGWCVVSARKLPWAVVMQMLGTATTRWAGRWSADVEGWLVWRLSRSHGTSRSQL
jgi:hypothetical protein